MMKLKEGDIFSIPIDTTTTGFGQIVKKFNGDEIPFFLVIIFNISRYKNNSIVLEEVVKKEILFIGIVLDGKWHNEIWNVVGNVPIIEKKIFLPFYKVGTQKGEYVVDYMGNLIRPTSLEENKLLDYRTTSSAAALECALKAHFNKIKWLPIYNEFKYSRVVETFYKIGKDLQQLAEQNLITEKKKEETEEEEEDELIVYFNYGYSNLEELSNLKSSLEKTLDGTNVGEYDGHEIATDLSDGRLYLYGPNAEKLFNTVRPVLQQSDFMKGAKAKLVFVVGKEKPSSIEVEI